MSGFLFTLVFNPFLAWIQQEIDAKSRGCTRACADDLGALLYHIAFLKASTNCIKDERRAASKAMEEEHHAIKLALVQEVLQLRKQAEASEERVRWLNQAFTLLYEQCEEEGLGDLCE